MYVTVTHIHTFMYYSASSMLSLIQDGFSEEQWMEAEEAIATAKVLGVELWFDDNSTHRQRAVTAITDRLAWNKFVRKARLYRVPEEMRASVKQKLCHSIQTVHVD